MNELINYIKEKHKGQKRKQGTPYYEHPVKVANILRKKVLVINTILLLYFMIY